MNINTNTDLSLIWHCQAFSQLSTGELYNLLQLRNQVFIVEQNCPYLDIDCKDRSAQHLWAAVDNQIVAYARILPAGISFEHTAIGRVCVHPDFRRDGLGRLLMKEALNLIHSNQPQASIKISAQTYLIPFYQSFGFTVVSAEYLEDNLPHVEMLHSSSSHH
ncbi:GNAT family N-acetyltransferase [Pseudomonas sp. F1_0610]|uniref:GNAT family N-acetyltransferase n=1 Tax=Pseudomonas sp. F1_0610 TaxID=3114284 RepID=UPI0039C23BC6